MACYRFSFLGEDYRLEFGSLSSLIVIVIIRCFYSYIGSKRRISSRSHIGTKVSALLIGFGQEVYSKHLGSIFQLLGLEEEGSTTSFIGLSLKDRNLFRGRRERSIVKGITFVAFERIHFRIKFSCNLYFYITCRSTL